MNGVGQEASSAAKAIGLFDADGNFSSAWFNSPLQGLENMLTVPAQRAALLDLLDQLFPPENPPGAAANEKWHPLLGSQTSGNLYLTTANGSGPIKLGIAGDVHSTAAALPASLRAHLPLISIGDTGISTIAGTADGPFDIEVRVELNWSRSTGQAIDLRAIRANASLSPLAPSPAALHIVLEGLSLEGSVTRDTELDPQKLGADAVQLVVSLVREKLREFAADPANDPAITPGASREAFALAKNLMPLLGLKTGFPPFPFTALATDPSALRNWFASLLSAGKLTEWLGHLGAIFGGTSPVSGSGAAADPWSVSIFQIDANSHLDAMLVQFQDEHSGTTWLELGFSASYLPAGPNPVARISASAALAAIPLQGTASARVLPRAAIRIVSPGNDGSQLINSANIKAQSAQGGIQWDGTNLVPLLELDDVTLTIGPSTQHYDRIDLTNTDSVVAAASDAAATLFRNALGSTGEGQHLLALLALAKPAGDPTWMHLVDVPALIAHPTQAVAAVHRAALLDGTHNWSFLFSELAALVGLGGAVSGSGTRQDPWRVTVAPGTIELQFAAWNQQESGNAADPQQLRIGLRAAFASAPWNVWWLAELLAVDLPQTGAGTVALMGGQHAAVTINPIPAIPQTAGISLSADSAAITLDWSPGGAMQFQSAVNNLVISAGSTVTIPSLKFPAAAGFDISNPLPSLGISLADLQTVFRNLLFRGLYSWAGMDGAAISGLLGLTSGLPGLPSDWPVLRGNFFADPQGSLRDWINHLATQVDLAGASFLPKALSWLGALTGESLPATISSQPPDFLIGSGTYDDPWVLPVASEAEIIAWLEPAGPPPNAIAALASAIGASLDFNDLLYKVSGFAGLLPSAYEALSAQSPGGLADSLLALSAWLQASDGFVSAASQIPTGPTWTAGTPVNATHFAQPKDASVIAQINTQIAAWNPGAKAVLLLGPAFSDHTTWDALLAPVALKPNFNLRVNGVDPQSIDLRTNTDVADFYTADLQENGLAGVVSQIGRVVDRIRELRLGIPVTLVAHSTAGLAATAYTAANPTNVKGLITIGTPHLGSNLPLLTDPALGNAVRAVEDIAPALAASPLQDALLSAVQAMDGYLPPAAAGQLPVPAPFPQAAFTAPASTDTAGVPALALGGALTDNLLDKLKTALGSLATAAAGSASPAPTHLAFGLRAHLDFGAAGSIESDVAIRCDAARIALRSGVAEPTRPAHALAVEITLSSNDGWLVGSPASDVRVRWAELALHITPDAIKPALRLHDGAFHSPALGLVDETHAQAQLLLGVVFHQIADLGAKAGASVTALLSALQSLGIAAPDTHGGMGISSDAWTALNTDPRGYLAPRLNAALASGLAGFTAADGTHVLPVAGGALQLSIGNGKLGIQTLTPLSFGEIGSLTIHAETAVSDFKPALGLSLTLGAATLTYSQATGHLTLGIPPWLDSLTLKPAPSASDLAAAFNKAVPRLLLSSALSAVIEAASGTGFAVGPIDRLMENPGLSLIASTALGNGTALDGTRISGLLKTIATAAGLPPGPGLALPGNVQLTASGADPVKLQVATTAALGGVLDLNLALAIDHLFHVQPSGTASLHLALPGTWGALDINFGVDASGVSLNLAPQVPAPNPPVPPIQLLPTFSGLGGLAGGGQALLPAALDALVDATGASTFKTNVLSVAQAFGLFDPAGKFSAHAAALHALTQGSWMSSVSSAMRTAATSALRDLMSSLTGAVSSAGSAFTIGLGGQFSLAVGWDTGPTFLLQATGLKPADGALSLDVALGFAAGNISASVAAGVQLASSLGVSVVPALQAAYQGSGFSVKLLPLGVAQQSTLSITLAPSLAVQTSADMPVALAEDLLLPVVIDLLIGASKTQLGQPVWAGGPTLQTLLQGAKLIDGAGKLLAIPPLTELFENVVATFAAQAQLTIGNFKLKFVDDATGLGVNLRGFQGIPLGSVGLSLRLENTDLPTATPGATIYLFQKTPTLQFKPRLLLAGLGLALIGPGDSPLIKNDSFRLESVSGNVFLDFDGAVHNLGGAVEAKGLGLPLGLLGGSHDGGNPVASSLLEGAGSAPGDPNPVNPALDVLVFYVDGSFGIRLGAPNPPLWLGVHRSFGPIYIEQIGVDWNNESAAMLVDGSVKVAALTVQAYELSLNFKFTQLLAPEHWTLDLQGLAVGFESGPVSISGGLIKNPGPPAVEYDGMLSAVIAGRGFTVVGGYARPHDSQGNFTSLFMFVALPIPLGGPPFLFVTGLGGGFGYNRELIPPTDLNQIPDFFLISAIDDDSLANDPMSALISMGKSMPPLRGGYWLAAGVRFNSFVVVNTIAVVYVALDRGFEIGILGLSHMQLPSPGIELVSIELALKVRFSLAEGLFSIQAQLTDNSWLFSHDCQLTGGFAFFIWFSEGHFVLTIGGYHPSFQKPPEFPIVPRLGFHWQVLGFVQIKGESYFAISSSAFMCGGRLEASAGLAGIRAWFTVHVDILIQWDPFHYDFLGGIEVGVTVDIEVCFFGACAGVTITISRGAEIHIFGPPFHADLTFDAYITSITLSFGGDPHPQPDPLPWPNFRDKYLISGNPENSWVGMRVVSGILVPDPPGAQPSPGTAADPFKLNPEFAFLTESRMPVSGYSVVTVGLDAAGATIVLPMAGKTDAHLFDLAAMHQLKVGSMHNVSFTPLLTHPNQFLVEPVMDLLPEAAWVWYDPSHLPAAANRIKAITGLRITGFAVLQGKSALIPISTLVDDDPRFARPLPFATVISVIGNLKTFGLTAEALAALAADASGQTTINAAAKVLAGTGFFAQARESTGLPSAGIPALATRALLKQRSAPPLLVPLTTGLSMKPVGLAAPPVFFRPAAVSAIALDRPRLRAVLQQRPQATVDATPSLHTSVTQVASAKIPRMAPPRLQSVTGSRLVRVAAPTAPAPTSAAAHARTLRNPELSALSGFTHAQNVDAATDALLAKGITVPAGTTHVWDVPGAFSLRLSGAATVRVVFMDRAGKAIKDVETVVAKTASFDSPPQCEMVAVTCLGSLKGTQLQVAPAFGAVTGILSAADQFPAVGWQAGNLLTQVGPSTLLARGASLVLRRPYLGSWNGQRATQAMTKASAAVAGQSGTETWLPKSVSVVMIILDEQDATAGDAGDLAVACQGGVLAVPPVAGAGGRHRALLYDVISHDKDADHLTVSVGSQSGWAVAGVVGLPGRAIEWAARLHGSLPPQLVPEGPLTADGEILVQMVAKVDGGVA